MTQDATPIRSKKQRKIVSFIVIFVSLGTLAMLYSVSMLRLRYSSSTLVSNSFIRQAIISHSLDSSSALPPRCVRMMLLDGTLNQYVFERRAYEDSLESVLINGRPLSTIFSDSETMRLVQAELQQPQQDGGWESIGRFRFSMEPGLYDTYEPHVIVALSCYEEEGVLVGFADVRVQSVGSVSELREMVVLDEIARNAIGFAPLTLNLEHEIENYRAGKGLPPFTD